MSAYRMTTHSVTGATPNLAMFGREVLIPATLIAQPPDEPSKPVTLTSLLFGQPSVMSITVFV